MSVGASLWLAHFRLTSGGSSTLQIEIPYGNSTLIAELPDGVMVEYVMPKAQPPVADDPAALVRRVRSYSIRWERSNHRVPGRRSPSPSMTKHARSRMNICCRLCCKGCAMPASSTKMCFSSSRPAPIQRCYRPNTASILPAEILDTYRVICHDAYDESNLTVLDETSRGTPVHINREYMDADYRIVIGNIEPHQFQGFSGGVKSAAIGLAGVKDHQPQSRHDARRECKNRRI